MTRWNNGPQTYTNYGRTVPGRVRLTQELIRLHIKAVRFYQLRAQSPEDKKWVARLIDGLEKLIEEANYGREPTD